MKYAVYCDKQEWIDDTNTLKEARQIAKKYKDVDGSMYILEIGKGRVIELD